MSPAPSEFPSPLPQRRDDLQEQCVGDDLMIYDPTHRIVHILNPTAATIFRLCDGTHDLDSLEEEMRESYEFSRKFDLRSDLLAVIQSFREKGLL
jgi:hypothetical protein